jgi:hypothetical protein
MGDKSNTYSRIGGKTKRKEASRKAKTESLWIILVWIFETGWSGTDWIDLAQDRDQWRALVNTVLNLQIQ